MYDTLGKFRPNEGKYGKMCYHDSAWLLRCENDESRHEKVNEWLNGTKPNYIDMW